MSAPPPNPLLALLDAGEAPALTTVLRGDADWSFDAYMDGPLLADDLGELLDEHWDGLWGGARAHAQALAAAVPPAYAVDYAAMEGEVAALLAPAFEGLPGHTAWAPHWMASVLVSDANRWRY